MTWKIATLDLGQVELYKSRLVVTDEKSAVVRVPVQGWLLTNGQDAVVIDTGFRNADILRRLGDRARGVETPQQRLAAQLERHGLRPSDVRYVLHTHLHIDHAGQTDIFPSQTTAVVNRRELEYSVSGLSGPSYPPEDIKHLIDRLHTPRALRMLDLDMVESEEILDGIRCKAAGGHTEGSMVVYVDSQDGLACFCGDLVYSVKHQLLTPRMLDRDPNVSANYVVSRRSEKAALKRMLNAAPRFRLFPSHDEPAEIERGQVINAVHGEGCGSGGCWCNHIEE
jgi:glyoxylase-like metal-dependent hydrolase (beta-lactamase superfamily II)